MSMFEKPFVEYRPAAKRLCYVYIYNYLSLKDVEIVIDYHFKYDLNLRKHRLTISSDDTIDNNFWGKHIYSLTSIVGNNGGGKTTAIRQIMEATVGGTDKSNLDALFVMYDGTNFKVYQPSGKHCDIIVPNGNVEDIDKDPFELDIPTFYYTGHTYFYSNASNLVASDLEGLYNASDGWRLVKDYEEYENEGSARSLSGPLYYYLNAFIAQDNFRICSLLANRKLRAKFDKIKLPRYIVLGVNNSGADVIRRNRDGLYNNLARFNYKSPYDHKKNGLNYALSQFIINNFLNLVVQSASFPGSKEENVMVSILQKWLAYHKGNNVIEQLKKFALSLKTEQFYITKVLSIADVLGKVVKIFRFDANALLFLFGCIRRR